MTGARRSLDNIRRMYNTTSCYVGRSVLCCTVVHIDWPRTPTMTRDYAEYLFELNIVRAGHVLRGSSGLNALLIMEGKISGVKARGRPRRAWTDDLKDWTELINYSELKRTAEDRTIWNALARQPST